MIVKEWRLIVRVKNNPFYNKSRKLKSGIGSFSRAKREGIFKNISEKTPSPWEYYPKPSFMINDENKGFTIKGKERNFEETVENGIPGPGTYNVSKK